MSKKLDPLMKPISISLPEDLGNSTLNDLLNSEDTEFSKKGNKLSFRRTTDYGTATLEIERYDTGRKTVTTSTVPPKSRKSGYLEDILQMKSMGIKQKDIAFRLGISESYVTQLLKSNAM